MEYELLTLQELEKKFSVLTKSQFLYRIEKRGESYVIPPELLDLLGYPDHTVGLKGGHLFTSRENTSTGGTIVSKTVPTGEVWELKTIQATFKLDANVANRTCELFCPSLGYGGVAASVPDSLLSTTLVVTPLTASQYAFIFWTGDQNYAWKNTNGSPAGIANSSIPNAYLLTGAILQADITANAQVGDLIGLDLSYRKWFLHE